MKNYIYLTTILILSLSLIGKSQEITNKNKILRDSINLKDICFNSVCIGDSLSKVYRAFTNPNNTIIEERMEDEDHPENITVFSRMLWGSLSTNYLEVLERKAVGTVKSAEANRVYLMNVKGRPGIYFSRNNNKIAIGSDIDLIKNEFPKSYKQATDLKQATLNGEIRKFENNKVKYDSLKLTKRYNEDIKYKNKIDKELGNSKDPRLVFNPNNIFINLGIKNNEFNYYNRLCFGYENNKLISIFIMSDY